LERAFDASWEALKTSRQHYDAETEEELEAALRRELIEIVRANEWRRSRISFWPEFDHRSERAATP